MGPSRGGGPAISGEVFADRAKAIPEEEGTEKEASGV